MSDTVDFGQIPIAYPEGFINAVALSNEDKSSDAGTSASALESPSSQVPPEQLTTEGELEHEVGLLKAAV